MKANVLLEIRGWVKMEAIDILDVVPLRFPEFVEICVPKPVKRIFALNPVAPADAMDVEVILFHNTGKEHNGHPVYSYRGE